MLFKTKLFTEGIAEIGIPIAVSGGQVFRLIVSVESLKCTDLSGNCIKSVNSGAGSTCCGSTEL